MTAQLAIIQALPIASIEAASNVRMSNGHDKQSLSELAASIQSHGLIQPIVVRPLDVETDAELIASGFVYGMVAGRRRLAACKLNGLETVPAIIANTDEASAYELEIAENIQREQMTLADTARAVRTLMLIHDKAATVGRIVNKSPAWVSKHLSLTANTFAPTVAELLDRNLVQDLETLLLLNQVAKVAAGNPAAMPTLTRMLKIAHAGDMNRQIARDALAGLKVREAVREPVTRVTTVQAANSQTTVTVDACSPAESFTVTLPIALLAIFEELGGEEWLICRLQAG